MIQHYLAAWKNFAKFDGRSRRSEYWWFVFINLIIQYAFMGIGLAVGIPAIALGGTIFSFIALIPSIAVAIRRMHDVGKSGWFCLIPIYNLILACTDSQAGPNKYGPNPKSTGLDTSDHLVA